MNRSKPMAPAVMVFFTLLAVSLFFTLFLLLQEDTGWILLPVAGFMALIPAIGIIALYAEHRRLQISAIRLDTIVENAADAILTTDSEGSIFSANSSAVAMFGYRAGELIGSDITVLFPSAFHDISDESTLRDFLQRNRIDASGRPVELKGLRRNGSTFYMECSLTENPEEETDRFTFILRDVTERAEARRALRTAHDNLEDRVCQRTRELEQANEKLRREIEEHQRSEEEREKLVCRLKEAVSRIRQLSGLLPICANCKKIRDDSGYWSQIEVYIREHSEADFSHGLCPDCTRELYPDLADHLEARQEQE
jgi:PAS domain S-box-containing protein